MNKWNKRIIIAFLGILLNIAGRYFAYRFQVPSYANVLGTIIAAYFEGPIVAGIVAVISCCGSTIFSRTDLYFVVADLAVAVTAGFLGKKNRYFENILLTISSTALFAIVRGVVFAFVNYFLYSGRTGMVMSDAIIDYLSNINFPLSFSYLIAAVHVAFTDVFIACFIIYLGIGVTRLYKKKKKAKKLKKALGGGISLVILTAVLTTGVFAYIKTDSYAGSGVYFIEKIYNAENGLVGGCLNDIDMTKDGTMWIGTYGGLYRFNGSSFFLIDDIKNVRSIQALYVDDYDRLWVGTQNAGITLLNIDKSYDTIDMSVGLPSNAVKDIISDSNGLFYVATTGGVMVYEYGEDGLNIIKTYESIANMKRFSADENGRVVGLNTIGEIYVFENGEIIIKETFDTLSPTSATFDKEGFLYLGTDSELIVKYSVAMHGLDKEKIYNAKDLKHIKDVFFDDSGYMYIASDSGIGYIDESGNASVIETGDFDNGIDTIFKDYQGNLWFTSSRCGLLSLSKSSFSDMFRLCNANSAVCNAIKEWNGYLYVGTDDGLKILNIEDGKTVFSRTSSWFEDTRVRCMTMDKSGKLLVATNGEGVMALSNMSKIEPYDKGDNPEKKVRLVYRLKSGDIVTSSDNGLIFFNDGVEYKRLRLNAELGGGTILNLLESGGTLLAGSDGDGIAIIKDGNVLKYITRDDGLDSGVILRIVEDEIGSGYFVLTGSGINYMTDRYEISELSVPYFNNFDLVQYEDKVFIIGGAGIFVVNYEALMEGAGNDAFKLLDIKAGLPGSLTSNAWNYVSYDGFLYVCGNNGIYSLDLDDYEIDVTDYLTKITAIKLDGEYNDVTEIGGIDVPRGTEKVELSLEINNYTTTDPNVRYYMVGVDKEKVTVPSSELETVSYLKLPYGDHDFHIEVLDDDGKVIKEQIYTITKERELYETAAFQAYFYSILILFVIFLVISIVQGALMAQDKKENNKHEKVVTQLEREKAEALERALHMEEDANRTKSEFLANMSHEIRTPINAIIGMDTMIMREANQAEIKGYAKDIHNASKTLLALINDILDFSKIESGKLELVLGEYDLSLVINDLVNMIKPKADGKHLKLEVKVNPDIPNGLYGDEVRIEQIIINILNNAIKYTEKGTVTFSVDYEDAEGGAIKLKISVKDTGIGIKPEDIEKLFSPYQRIDEQRNKKIEGTGLGMSITKNLLEKMGSHLEVTSVYGEGSNFSFEIIQPVRTFDKIGDFKVKAEGKDTVITDVERYHAPDAHILIVDDVEMNLIVATSLLKRIQIGIETANCGKDAIALAKQKHYDIILLDSMMPEMSGEETMGHIKAECPENADTPIIVLTAHAVKGAREEYLRLGYTNYLSKPLDGIKLEAMLQSYLPDDKIIPVDEQEIAKNNELAGNDEYCEGSVLGKIGQIEGIELSKGIETAGGEDAYGVICRNFYDTAKMRMGMIKDTFEREDIQNYTIQVHALKSSARLIGAYSFSEKALELETAGRESNISLIKEKTGSILEEYNWFYDKFAEIFGAEEEKEDEDDKPELSEEDLKGNLNDMAELLEAFDFDTAKELFDSFEDYKLPEDFKDMYSAIKSAMAEVDRDSVIKLIHIYNQED
ncbi:MAG: response regulator [Lachnospiraceae bacterium]|nr:response regulator [Lachnospiraceae bacterium]